MTNADAIDRLAKDLSEKAKVIRTEQRRKEREERQARERAEITAHRDRMFAEVGQPLDGLNEAQHGIVYDAAWEQGHSSGFGNVEHYYGEFSEMARKLLAAQ